MAHHDASTAEVLVFTFKEGLLSAVAHDLKLRATRFTLELTDDRALLELEAGSLGVQTAMQHGVEAPAALPAFAKAEIEKNLGSDEVLAVKRYPTVKFESTRITDTEVEGALTLHGVTTSVRGARRDQAHTWVAEFRIDQRDFAMKPYSAMLGTLRLRPEVVVRVSAPKHSIRGV